MNGNNAPKTEAIKNLDALIVKTRKLTEAKPHHYVTTEKRICQNCRAWEQSDATCRRKSASGDGYFPVADADQWCWEFV